VDQVTAILIEKYSPMWTNKQVWEFEQSNPELRFDVMFSEQGGKDWNSKHVFRKCEVRETIIDNFDYLADGYTLWVANSDNDEKLDEKYIPYLMALLADIMIDEEITLKFRIEGGLGVLIDYDADVIDCKEFFEEFYHLATGVNYDTDTGIPEDETEAEIYLTRLQEEFDHRMIEKLGDKYLPGNNDPESINAE